MMKGTRMVFAASLAVFVAAGCSVDVAKQLASNEQVRTQVLDAIASNPELTGQLLNKLTASDSTRIKLVDDLLQNEQVAQQVLVRVGMNPDAMNMVIGVAVQDSAMRGHVIALVKGIEMGAKQRK
jgi:hypothetical protein